MRRTFTVFLTAVMFSLLLPNCATIVTPSSYPLAINCNPPGSKVEIVDKHGVTVFMGTTPTTLKLKAGAGFFSPARYTVYFFNDGYDQTVVSINARLDGWYFGNILIGGFLGMLIIDPATGAMWKIDERVLNVDLVPNNQQVLNIIDIKDLPEEYKDHLVKITE